MRKINPAIAGLFTALALAASLAAQTIFVPGGTVGTSATGNVGIGTATPANKFEVFGDGSRLVTRAASVAGSAWVEAQANDYWSTPTYSGTALVQYGSTAAGSSYGFPNAGLGILQFQNTNIGLIASNGGAPLVFGTFSTERMRITYSGNVGIGTAAPGYLLHLAGANPRITAEATNSGGNAGLYAKTLGGVGTLRMDQSGNWAFFNGATAAAETEKMRIDPSGNVGIGTVTPVGCLTISSNGAVNNQFIRFENTEPGNTRIWNFGTATSSSGAFVLNDLTAGAERFRVASNGNVGIGTTNPTQKLSVAGTIQAKEVIVQTGWSDYVFKPEYHLASLSEVEGVIKHDGHLPGIPSAQEVAEHGVSMGDMQSKLLAKVEELTLHLIAQEKEIAALRWQVAELKAAGR